MEENERQSSRVCLRDSDPQGATLGEMVESTTNVLGAAADRHPVLQDEEEKLEGLRSRISRLSQKKADLEERIQRLLRQKEEEQIDGQVKLVQGEVKTLKGQLVALEEAERARIDLKDGDHEKLKQLQSLVHKNDVLKRKEREFKSNCKTEQEHLLRRNEKIKAQVSSYGSSCPTSDKKLDHLKSQLATTSRAVVGLERQLDRVPSAHELQQYQIRFYELDNQVSAEFSSTQQFVILFNMLVDQKCFMEKAVGLLETVLDTLPDSQLSSQQTKAHFLEKLSHMSQSVDQAMSAVDKAFKAQEARKLEAQEELNQLLDDHRTYALLVRNMGEEMKKNGVLSSQVAARIAKGC